MSNATQDPVTIVITRAIRAGREAAFEAAVREWIKTALDFPGYLGVHMIRPPSGGREYGAVLKFQSRGAWDSFLASPDYQKFLDGIREHLDGDPNVETVCGLESWFTGSGAPIALAPPRWKMALVTWVGVDITALVLTYSLSLLMKSWPWGLAFLVFNAGVVAGLTWIVMPFLSRLFRPWLSVHQKTSS